MARLIGLLVVKLLLWVLVPVLFELTGIYRLNGNRVPEYFFISDTGGTVTCVETARPNMAPVGVASTS
jgi:hypothetical protein